MLRGLRPGALTRSRFRNEFRDLYDEAFPWVEVKRKRRDEEKPWLDDGEFKDQDELTTKLSLNLKYGPA